MISLVCVNRAESGWRCDEFMVIVIIWVAAQNKYSSMRYAYYGCMLIGCTFTVQVGVHYRSEYKYITGMVLIWYRH